jgi:hypothetical protein
MTKFFRGHPRRRISLTCNEKGGGQGKPGPPRPRLPRRTRQTARSRPGPAKTGLATWRRARPAPSPACRLPLTTSPSPSTTAAPPPAQAVAAVQAAVVQAVAAGQAVPAAARRTTTSITTTTTRASNRGSPVRLAHPPGGPVACGRRVPAGQQTVCSADVHARHAGELPGLHEAAGDLGELPVLGLRYT